MFANVYKTLINEAVSLKLFNESKHSNLIKEFAGLTNKEPSLNKLMDVYSSFDGVHIDVEKYAIDFVEHNLSKINESDITKVNKAGIDKFAKTKAKNIVLETLDQYFFDGADESKKIVLKSKLVGLLKEDVNSKADKDVEVFTENYKVLSETSKTIVDKLLAEDTDGVKETVNTVIIKLLESTKNDINQSNSLDDIKSLISVQNKLTEILSKDIYDNETIASIIDLSENLYTNNVK